MYKLHKTMRGGCKCLSMLLAFLMGYSPCMQVATAQQSPCLSITARCKSGKVQLTWTHLSGTERYEVYRSSESDPSNFVKIGETTSTYSTYLDSGVQNEKTYLYFVGAYSQDNQCDSDVVSSHPTASRTPANYSPVIYSLPITQGTNGIAYTYDVNATDPNGDTLTYSLLMAPPSMSIHPVTGLIQWAPPSVGDFNVTVRVNDGKGKTAQQSFVVHVKQQVIPNTPPVANAGPDQTAYVGDVVSLDGSKSSDADGDSLYYYWSFLSRPAGSSADVSDPNAIQPTFNVDRPGTYVLQLIVNDGIVDSLLPDTITISTQNSRPVAEAGPAQTVYVGKTVTLDGSGSSDRDGDSLSFAWSFVSLPAGSTAALSDPKAVNPTFLADKPGAYVVRLLVNDGQVDSIPDTVTISTQNSPPVAHAGPNQTVSVGATVLLDGSQSSDVDGDALSYSWSWVSKPAGSLAAFSDPQIVKPDFVVDKAGNYVAQLRVNDGQVNSAPDTVTISTQNSPPVANAGPDQGVLVRDTVTLDGSGSSDVDGNALTFRWSFVSRPAGSAATLSDATVVKPTFVVDKAGNYVAQLIVNDGFVDSAPDTLTITTAILPPVANAGPDQTVFVGDTVALDGSGSSDVDGNALTFSWSFVSRPAGSASTLSDATAVKPTFVVDRVGYYVVQLIVNDGFVDSVPDTLTITIANSPPVANAGPDQTVLVNTTVTLDGSVSSDVDGDPLSCAWSIVSRPVGSTASLSDPAVVHPTFLVDRPGDYVAQLIVNDGQVNSQPDTVTISTVNTKPVANAGLDQTIAAGKTVYLDGSGSFDADHDTLFYQWSLSTVPAGSVAALSDPGLVNPSFGSDKVGMYIAQLMVYDGKEYSDPDTVAIQATNSPPKITSLPITAATEDQPYSYDVDAVDPTPGDILTYSLSASPVGMTINATTGVIQWTPTYAQVGPNQVVVQVSDLAGASDSQTFTITVAHKVVTVPNVVGLDQTVAEAAIVTTQLTVGVITQANSPTVPAGQVISQTPVAGTSVPTGSSVNLVVSLGPVMVTVPNVVGQTQTAAQAAIVAAQLTVGTVTTANSPTVPAGQVISQTPAAGTSIPTGSSVNLVVSLGPVMATVPNVVGQTQAAAQAAIVAAQLTVGTVTTANSSTVPAGQVISQTPAAGTSIPTGSSVNLVVSLGPVMVTVPNVVGQTQTAAQAAIVATQLTVGIVTTANSDTVPAGQVISQIPAAGTSVPTGTGVDLVVSMGPVPDYIRPEVNVTVTPAIAPVGSPVTITVQASDNIGVVSKALTVDGVAVPLDASGNATYSSSVAGIFQAVGTALDAAGNEGLASQEFVFHTTGDVTPPTVDISVPVDNTKFAVPTNIIGTASDANLISYKLEYSVKDKNEFVTFASGKASVVNGLLGTLDPTMMRNGLYDVRLTAEDASGNIVSVTRTYQLEGEMKVGNFTIGFNDLTIPMAGMPITVTRTYDSRVKTKGDFGVGWNIDLKTIDIQEDRTPGSGWQLYCKRYIFSLCLEYGVQPSVSHSVVVNIPGMREQEFDVQAVTSYAMGTMAQGYLTFTPKSGTFSTLTALDSTTYDWLMGGELQDFGFNIINPDRYQLTMVDGTVYVINQFSGVESIKDPNGNTITFGPNGIIHSAGKSVLFTRDAQGRITTITDPMGNTIQYAYDFYGDLVSVTDQAGNVTRFTYNSSHGLVDIIDPRGIRPARNEYDDQGRLVAHVDADGNRIGYTHNVGARQEVIKDRLGNLTVYNYDDKGNVLSKTDPLGHTTSYTYDARNNKLSETDPLGHTTTCTYDAQDNMLGETDPLNNKTEYTYNSRGQVLTTKDPRGNSTINTYDAPGNLLTTTDSLGNTTTYTYDAAGNMTKQVDPMSYETTYTYDSNGNMTSQTDANGHITTYTYDANGNQLTQTTTVSGQTITITNVYDANNRLVRTIDPYGNSIQTAYNSIGKQSATIDKTSSRTEYEYDSRGNLIRTRYPDGTQEVFTYDLEGRKLTSTDRDGRVTSYTYDTVGRLIKTTYPDGAFIQTDYDDQGQVVKSIGERGNTTTYGYDAAGHRTSITNALGQVTHFEYDSNGNQVKMIDANGNQYQYEYDKLNRRTKTVFPNSSTIIITYDSLGRKTSETDQAGNTTQFEYDPMGRLVKVTDALNNVTQYAYDEAGNMITQTDANGHVTTFEYDKLGRRVRRTLPLGMSETTVWACCEMTSSIDFNGNAITFEYDTNKRLTKKTYLDGSEEIYTYTSTGQRETVVDSRGVTSYEYDLRDRLTKQTNPDGSSLAYTYDAAGNRTSVAISSSTTQYTFDKLNRLATVTDPDGGVTTYTYDAVGNRASVILPNGTVTDYTYDNLNRLTNLLNRKADGTVVSSYAYTLAPNGNRTRVVEHNGRTVDYEYDATYKLTRETITDPVNGNRLISYSYDPVGNRLTKTDNGVVTSYTYDENDRLLSEGGNTYSYDNNGNTISKTGPVETATYTYDFQNRMIGAIINSGGISSSIDYAYDVDGIRVQKVVNGTDESNYLIDKNRDYAQVLEERNAGGNLVVSYIHGDDLLSQKRSATVNYYQYDGLGSTRALTDASVNITDTFIYEAFGTLIARTGTTENEFLFTGEQYDPNVGFYYLRARYYNSAIARFVVSDSYEGVIYDPASLHKYLYCHNDPVNNVDPSGQMTLVGVMVIVVILALLVAAVVYWLFKKGPAHCTFTVSGEILTCTVGFQTVSVLAFSGFEEKRGQSQYENDPGGRGPLPRGFYWIGKQGAFPQHPTWYHLWPKFTTQRTDMYLHEGSMSYGCLTVPADSGQWPSLARLLNQADFEPRPNDHYTGDLRVSD